MSPAHPGWKKFAELLEGPEGCDFKQTVKGDPGSTTFKCGGGKNKEYATAILKKYFPKIDVEKTLAYFEKRGGYCDCEILFNIYKTY